MPIASCVWVLLAMIAGAAPASDIVYLKGAQQGVPSTVLEETDAYVLVKIPKSEVVRIERAAASTLPPGALAGDTRPPAPLSYSAAPKAEVQPAQGPLLEGRENGETGNAVGRMLWKGQPLGGARVKILLLNTSGFFKTTRLVDVGRETITDDGGFYRFEQLAPGRYKLYWVPPGGTHWIRRLRVQPDFQVGVNEQTDLGPLEISARTLN